MTAVNVRITVVQTPPGQGIVMPAGTVAGGWRFSLGLAGAANPHTVVETANPFYVWPSLQLGSQHQFMAQRLLFDGAPIGPLVSQTLTVTSPVTGVEIAVASDLAIEVV